MRRLMVLAMVFLCIVVKLLERAFEDRAADCGLMFWRSPSALMPCASSCARCVDRLRPEFVI